LTQSSPRPRDHEEDDGGEHEAVVESVEPNRRVPHRPPGPLDLAADLPAGPTREADHEEDPRQHQEGGAQIEARFDGCG
jgi:hypothetical protein